MNWAETLYLSVFVCLLCLAAAIDLRVKRIPDWISLGFLTAGMFGAGVLFSTPLADRLIGAGLGFLVLWGIGEIYFRSTATEGLGIGDAKLLGGLGAWFGPETLPFIVLVSSLSGLLVAAAFWCVNRANFSRELAFGPFLAVGGGLAMAADFLG